MKRNSRLLVFVFLGLAALTARTLSAQTCGAPSDGK